MDVACAKFLAGAPLLFLAGCAVRQPAAWRLTGTVLTPPIVQAAITTKSAEIANGCTSGDAIRIEHRKRRVRLAIDGAALEQQPRGWLAQWSARCGPPAERILDSVPLDSATRIRLIRDADIRAGFLDLTLATRLQVITPTTAQKPLDIVNISGTDKSINVDVRGAELAFTGREVSWYGFEPRPGGGTSIVRVSPGAQNYYSGFSAETAWFRFFYMADRTSVVVGASSFDKLPRDLAACGKPGGPECISVPPKVGVNAYMRLRVNGEDLVVPYSATVRNVIQSAKKRPEEVLPTLVITKLFGSEQVPLTFDRSKPDILNLWLVGNEEIQW
jgi:hypothetical protein